MTELLVACVLLPPVVAGLLVWTREGRTAELMASGALALAGIAARIVLA